MIVRTSDVGQGHEISGGCDGAAKRQLWSDMGIEELAHRFESLPSNARVPLHEGVDANKDGRPRRAHCELVALFNYSRIQEPAREFNHPVQSKKRIRLCLLLLAVDASL